jgi:hypothetical protein
MAALGGADGSGGEKVNTLLLPSALLWRLVKLLLAANEKDQ